MTTRKHSLDEFFVYLQITTYGGLCHRKSPARLWLLTDHVRLHLKGQWRDDRRSLTDDDACPVIWSSDGSCSAATEKPHIPGWVDRHALGSLRKWIRCNRVRVAGRRIARTK